MLVDKNRSQQPAWNPAQLEDVTQDFVMSFFKPFEDHNMELDFAKKYHFS